ncbi:MAG: DUF1566 domain-containing protein [Methylococcaceae bacterium]
MKTKFLATLVLSIGLSTGAQAALFDRGSGMIYDSTLDITWAADANLAQTLGISADGKMTWDGAVNLTSELNKLDLGGHSDWRLPTLSLGAVNQADNEMGHLFGVDLAGAATHGVINVQDLNYWSGTESSSTGKALSFVFKDGTQSTSAKESQFYAWVVHNGDVGKMSPVPVPAAIWLFGSGLIALLGVKRLGNIG